MHNMKKLDMSEKEVYDAFNNGARIVTCCGLWNDPRTKGDVAQKVEDIYSLYHWASMVEVKKYDNDDTIYLHGYSYCDMF